MPSYPTLQLSQCYPNTYEFLSFFLQDPVLYLIATSLFQLQELPAKRLFRLSVLRLLVL
jgi:hypothetical protein